MSPLYEDLISGQNALDQAKVLVVVKKMKQNEAAAGRPSRSVSQLIDDCELDAQRQRILNAARTAAMGGNWDREVKRAEDHVEAHAINEIVAELTSANDLASIDVDKLIVWAQTVALVLIAKGLKTSQIRRFFSAVRGLEVDANRRPEEFSRQNVSFLKVHLAYAAARQEAVKPLMKVVRAAIDKIRSDREEGLKDFKAFVRLIEAIVAYHKYYGGSE